jgi:hypothetical protein
VRLLDTASSRRRLAGGLGSQLLAGSLATSGLAGSLLGTSHEDFFEKLSVPLINTFRDKENNKSAGAGRLYIC